MSVGPLSWHARGNGRPMEVIANGGSAAVELFVLAALTLLPGVYASYHLIGIKMRWPGFDNVAMFHEDVQFV